MNENRRFGGHRVKTKYRALPELNISREKKNKKKQLLAKLLRLSNKFGKKSLKSLLPFLKKIKLKKLLSKFTSKYRQRNKPGFPRREKQKSVLEDDLLFLPYKSDYNTKKGKRNFSIKPNVKTTHLKKKQKKNKVTRHELVRMHAKSTNLSAKVVEKGLNRNQNIIKDNADIFDYSEDFLVSDSTNIFSVYEGENKTENKLKPGSMHKIKAVKEKETRAISKSQLNAENDFRADHKNLISGEVGKSGDEWKVKYIIKKYQIIL